MLDVRNWLKVVETGTRKEKISFRKKKINGRIQI